MSITEQARLNATNPPRHAQMLIAGAWVDSTSGETLGIARSRPQRKHSLSPPSPAN